MTKNDDLKEAKKFEVRKIVLLSDVVFIESSGSNEGAYFLTHQAWESSLASALEGLQTNGDIKCGHLFFFIQFVW